MDEIVWHEHYMMRGEGEQDAYTCVMSSVLLYF